MADDDKKLEHINVKVIGQVRLNDYILNSCFLFYFSFIFLNRIIRKFISKLNDLPL